MAGLTSRTRSPGEASWPSCQRRCPEAAKPTLDSGLLTVVLVTSWLLLIATALAAELTLSAGPVTRRHQISKRETRMNDQDVTAAVTAVPPRVTSYLG